MTFVEMRHGYRSEFPHAYAAKISLIRGRAPTASRAQARALPEYAPPSYQPGNAAAPGQRDGV